MNLLKVGERLSKILVKLQTSVMYANAEPSLIDTGFVTGEPVATETDSITNAIRKV